MSTLKTIVRLATPTCFVIGLILGTFLVCNQYQSWTPVYCVAAGIVGPPILYLIVDRQSTSRTVRSFGCFVLRLYWRHVRLATYLWTTAFLAWLLVGVTAVSVLDRNKRASAVGTAGPESEQFFGFTNGVSAPLQLAWSGLVLLWQACVFMAVICFEWLSKWVSTHAVFSVSVATVLYLAWLVINVRELWNEEFSRQPLRSEHFGETLGVREGLMPMREEKKYRVLRKGKEVARVDRAAFYTFDEFAVFNGPRTIKFYDAERNRIAMVPGEPGDIITDAVIGFVGYAGS